MLTGAEGMVDVLALGVLVLAEELANVPKAEPPDLVEYTSQVRTAGASEMAQSLLRTSAAIITGDSVVEFLKDDDGDYRKTVRDASCLRPGLSTKELAQMRDERATRERAVMDVLRHFADRDKSGFVTTNEALQTLRVLEFGIKLNFLTSGEARESATLYGPMKVSGKHFDELHSAYCALVQAFDGRPVKCLPRVVVLGAAAKE